MSTEIRRPLPVVTDRNEFFWTAGRDGVLRFTQCNDCKALLHPPVPVCRYCRSDDIGIGDVSGRGIVVGTTLIEHQTDPSFPVPHLVMTVAIEEDPRVRIISNLADPDRDLDAVHVGARVRARFEQHDDVWIPLFELDGGDVDELPTDEIDPAEHARFTRPMISTDKFEDRVALTGIGMSQVGRRLMRPPLALTVEAIKAAVADAGLELSDIDGLSTYPGLDVPGFAEGGITAVEDALGLRPNWINGGMETFGPAGSVIAAALAVSAGLARHVVCFRTVWEATFTAEQRAQAAKMFENAGAPAAAADAGPAPRRRVAGFTGPYGLALPASSLALYASHHFRKYGTTRETLGWVALNQRANATLNPTAIYRDPMTMDDYLSARMISTPFGLYDCDVPMDGAVAVVVSARETAADLRRPPVLLEAVGTQITERISWEQSTMTHEPQVLGAAAHLWTRTTLRPDDVQVAELYDGFTFNCVSWLEGLSFCGIGEAKDFLDGGRNIAREGGIVALNTHGGQLSAGRTHGMGLVYEAVVQLRGDGGARQVEGARVAAVSSGGLTPSGAMLLRADA